MIETGRCTIVAEAGVNHDGDFERAVQLVEAAAEAGADVVKFQLFRAEEVASELAPKAGYQLRTTGAAGSQVDMLRALELPPDAFPQLLAEARRRGLGFFATCYAEDELDLLDDAGVEAFKFASAQIVELPLLVYAARKGKRTVQPSVAAYLSAERQALTPSRLDTFRRGVVASKLKLYRLLDDVSGQGARIYGIGAPSRAATMVNYVGLDDGIVSRVLEITGSHKIGKYMPGTLIPVVDEEQLFTDQPDYALLFSWHIADELVPKLRGRGYRGRFIVPLPEPRLVK